MLQNHLSADEITDYLQHNKGRPARDIYSVTVFAQKPVATAGETKPAASCRDRLSGEPRFL